MHRNHRQSQKQDNVIHRHPQANLHCQVLGCAFVACNFSELCFHLRIHIRDGRKVCCPVEGCLKYFRVRTSFTTHISRKHKQPGPVQQSCLHKLGETATPTDLSLDGQLPPIDLCINSEVPSTSSFQSHINTDEEAFLHNLALFYLKMQGKMLLPASTIQSIIEEFQAVHVDGMQAMLVRLKEKLLSSSDIPSCDIDKLIDELVTQDLLTLYNEGQLKSDKTRKHFFKQKFNFVEPKQIYLGTDTAGKERFCQYVPVKETLASLFMQTSVREQYNQSKMLDSADKVMEDIKDGTCNKQNAIFHEHPSSLSIMLYQDAFEVVNPLGLGKKKHKILAVYMTLGEILPQYRSLVDPMQLVLLCRDEDFKQFGQQKVFSSLVADLKYLEDSGFQSVDGTILKAGLIVICGDNLGSHCIGGFSENFSTNKYFCRYCLIDRDTFRQQPLNLGLKRTNRNYAHSVDQLTTTDQCMVDGIKFNSVFNSLNYFHVCGGLPPCLGHDLFEGIVANDLAVYIKHLVTVEKHFTYNELNRAITQFRHLGSDSHNAPCAVKADGRRLGGSATQNWCLLRLLPIYVGSKIENPIDSDVWQLCLKLKEMVELICAPKICHNEIGYLKFLTQEYVSVRSSLFPYESLKAKHHYLLHYADLILHFGPLIRLWTLRFESKHSYFKNCARKLHNFLHLCKTLAERHQMLQSYLACGQLFPPKIQSVSETHIHNTQLYNTKIQTAIRAANCVTQSTSEVSGVVYKGTKYTNGLVVVVDHNSCGYIFGKISLILISPTDVHFVAELYESVLLSDLGVHSLQKYDPKYVCVNADSLLDYYPLPVYKVAGISVVSLHHSVCSF